MKTKIFFLSFICFFFGISLNAQNISAGYYHSTVVCSDSTVWVAGSNTYAQKGNLTDLGTNQFSQIQLKGINNSSGGNNVVLLDDNNDVWAWGYNKFGQSGAAFGTSVTEADLVSELNNIIQIESAENSTFALKNDGSLWVWGYNQLGQLGLGTKVNVNTPTKVDLEGVQQISASQSHTLALLKNGKIMAWGNNLYGALGQEESIKKSLLPVEVSGLTDVVKVVTGTHYSVVLKSDGSVWSWGFNEHGMLGQGHNNVINSPAPVGGLNNIVDIVSGQSHILALTADGKVFSWGLNIYAQLGNGTYNNSNLPVDIGLTNVEMIAAGEYHSMATTSSGELYTWGLNNSGQLGDNTQGNKSTPTKIDLPCLVQKLNPVCPTQAVANSNRLSVCKGESIDFSNTSQNTTNHKWLIQNQEIEEETTSFIFENAGEFEVQLIANPDGCSDVSSLFVTVHDVPDASFDLVEQTCLSGDSVILTAVDSSGIWSGEGVTNNTFKPVDAGIYKVYYAIDNDFCQAVDSNIVEVIASPIADFDIIMLSDSTIEVVNNGTSFSNVEWFFGDGTSSTDLSPIHTYDTSGVFNIVQLVDNPCGNDAAQKQVVISNSLTSVSIIEDAEMEVSVFPNPAKDKVVISGQVYEASTIRVTNTLGQKMIEFNVTQSSTGFVKQIDISNYESGIYYIAVIVEGKQSITKLIVTE